jgi:hypothetical protein
MSAHYPEKISDEYFFDKNSCHRNNLTECIMRKLFSGIIPVKELLIFSI